MGLRVHNQTNERKNNMSDTKRINKLLDQAANYRSESERISERVFKIYDLRRQGYLDHGLTMANAYRELAYAVGDAKAIYGEKK